MASHRKPRPGGTRGPGLRGPALATAAFTSVAVLSQTAEAATDDGRPSMEEIEKKIDELYRRADSSPEDEPAARQRAREEEPRQESARRGNRRAKAPEGRVASAAGPDTAASLLAEFPQDHFAQNRVMNRLASRVRDTAERGRTGRSPRTPDAGTDAAPYDVKAAKAAVQRKLATTRDLLSRLTPQEHARPTEPDPAPWGTARPAESDPAPWSDARPAKPDPAPWADARPAEPDPAPWSDARPAESDPTPWADARPAEADPAPWQNVLPAVLAQAAWEDGPSTASGPAAWEDGPSTASGPAAWEDGPSTGSTPATWEDRLPAASAPAAWEGGPSTGSAPATRNGGRPAVAAPAAWEDGLPAVPAPATWEDTGPQTYAAATPSPAPAPAASAASQQATKAEKAIAFARAQLGRPYVSGASGPGSYDCSGLTQAAWRAAGVTLPRAARDQAVAGTPVALADARPGDLVFFHEDSSHVGLYTGDGAMIHAPEPGAYIREEPVHRGGEGLVQGVVRPA
ncbi:NlpC/P60 family protein [Streptomyces sp. 1222.5]|uniref:C40 family peptidase n=1 Tax=Streptomyces sp. 1222.5 TaxID=1881026 RepID=UPI003D73C8B1